MKRHPALQDLSRDHHHVLVRSVRFQRLVDEGAGEAEVRPWLEEFHVFWTDDLEPHLREEAELVLPLALRVGPADLAETAHRLRRDADALGRLARSVRTAGPATEAATIKALADALQAHVRDWESALFEPLQSAASADQLDELRRTSRSFRTRHRHADASGPRRGRG